MMASRLLLVSSLAVLFGRSSAGDFLRAPKIKVEEIEADFLQEMADGVSANKTDAIHRIDSLEAALRPMYASVPKEADGTLSHNVVRHVLRKLFARRHGWSLRGLELGNGSTMVIGPRAVNASLASAQAAQEWVPGYLQKFLEGMVIGRGINLRQLSVFAATLEDLIKKEQSGRLRQAYASLLASPDSNLDSGMAFEILRTYMMIYMLGGNWTKQMASQVDRLEMLFERKVSHWHDTLSWLRRLTDEIPDRKTIAQSSNISGLDFNGSLEIVTKIGDRYSAFNDAECGRLKNELVSIESAKPGRVRLVDFYKRGLHGAWEFNEKIDFLRDIGTLDESDPSTPLVIVPNYVQSRTNCIVVSTFYAVCCKNECDQLMERLEGEIASSTARPAQIAKAVSKMPSSTVTAPRTLSKPLMRRLQDVASYHRGQVPLHGRLFAQWMHHAFPRECAYPNAAGTAKAQTADEWMEKTGQAESKATEIEMLQEVAGDTCRLLPKGVECGHGAARRKGGERSDEDNELPWDSQEELLVVHESSAGRFHNMVPGVWLSDLVFFLAVSSMLYAVFWAVPSTSFGLRVSQFLGLPSLSKKDKCCV